jgi:hypothetical protein
MPCTTSQLTGRLVAIGVKKPCDYLADPQFRSPRNTHHVSSWRSPIDRWRQNSLQCRHPVPHASNLLFPVAYCNTRKKSTHAFSLLHRRNVLKIVLRRLRMCFLLYVLCAQATEARAEARVVKTTKELPGHCSQIDLAHSNCILVVLADVFSFDA